MAASSSPRNWPGFPLAVPCVLATAILATWGVLSVLPGCACGPGTAPRERPSESGDVDVSATEDRFAEPRTESGVRGPILGDLLHAAIGPVARGWLRTAK